MKIILRKFGALTSKPYAFKARSWELRNTESIDLFDSLCSNVRIDIRGSEIMRILPINNDLINEEWISDKARYAYDGLNRERFINPMIKKDKVFVQCSWKNALSFIKETIHNTPYKNLIINTGNFNDLESLISINEFSKKLIKVIRPTINFNIKTNSDFQEYYLLNDNIFNVVGYKVFLLVGVNLRLENPILNIRLKKLSNNKNILIGYIGSRHDYNLNLVHLGNNFSSIKEVLSGKHSFSTLITNFLKKDLNNNKIKNIFKNKISIIFGNEILQTGNHVQLIESIKQITPLANKVDFNVIENFSGKINMLELGLFNYNMINKTEKSIFYLLNTEWIENYKSTDFVIFQGHHNTNIRNRINVILPNVIWTEKSGLYLNCFGFLQKSQFVTLPPVNCRNDWKITLLLLHSLFNLTWKRTTTSRKILSAIHTKLNKTSPSLLTLLGKSKFKSVWEKNIVYKTNLKKVNEYFNMPFKSFIHNYYKVTSVEKASKIMDKCSKYFSEKKTNFFN
jgi:NADH dehydrogenase/NADH:ubiquinone oxidoreductase subunit G